MSSERQPDHTDLEVPIKLKYRSFEESHKDATWEELVNLEIPKLTYDEAISLIAVLDMFLGRLKQQSGKWHELGEATKCTNISKNTYEDLGSAREKLFMYEAKVNARRQDPSFYHEET